MTPAADQNLTRAIIAIGFFIVGGAVGEAWTNYRYQLAHETRSVQCRNNDNKNQANVDQPSQPRGLICERFARDENQHDANNDNSECRHT